MPKLNYEKRRSAGLEGSDGRWSEARVEFEDSKGRRILEALNGLGCGEMDETGIACSC